MTGAGPSGHRGPALGKFGAALRTVLPAWLAGRALILASLVVAHLTVRSVRPDNPAAVLRVGQGLVAWDGGWYETIARHGYSAAGVQSVRFYPLFPLVGRLLGGISGVGAGAALVVVANLSILTAMALLVVLVERDLGDHDLGRRSAWLLGLAPSAYVFGLAYADASLVLCAVVAFLGARSGRWWWAAGAGLAAGLLRPVGILLVVPVVVEGWRAWRRYRADRLTTPAERAPVARTSRPRWGLGAAVVAPVVGTAIYLGWVRHQFGNFWLPFRIQQQHGHRGALTVPVTSTWHTLRSALHGHHLGSALHVPWVILCVVLVVVAFRRLPASYGAFSLAILAVAATSSNLDSFERYALGAFPLVVAASTLTSRRGVEALVLILSGLLLAAYALLAFFGVVVP